MEGVQGVIRIFAQMVIHGSEFYSNLNQMQSSLTQLAEDIERRGKKKTESGLAFEQRVQDAERQVERAKAKYDSLANELNHEKRSPKSPSSLRITLRGPKSAGQFEEDLYHRVKVADEEYREKVVKAQKMRQELVSTRREVVRSLKSLISEIDTALTTKMQELGM